MKKILLVLFGGLLSFSLFAAPNHTGAFITIWDTGKILSGFGPLSSTLTIGSEGNNYEYYWEKVGDEINNNSGSYKVNSGNINTGINANSGVYKLYVKGAYERINMGGGTAFTIPSALVKIESWGNVVWKNMNNAFYGCSNLESIPSTAPNLTQVSDMSNMFYDAVKLKANLGNWQLKANMNLTDMLKNVALGCENYSRTLMGWAQNVNTPTGLTLGVTNLKYAGNAQQYRDMLTKASGQGGKGWTITGDAVDNSCAILDHAGAFITIWDTQNMSNNSLIISSEGTNYEYYWEKVGDEINNNSGSYKANSGNLALTDIKAKTGIYRVYIKGAYKRIIATTDYNSALALVEVQSWGSIVWESMEEAFMRCSNLIKLPAEAPDLSKVTSASRMFYLAKKFNSDIGNWNVGNITNMNYMFYDTSFDKDISGWDVSKVTNMSAMFSDSPFNQNINAWNVGSVKNMSAIFYKAKKFNQNIGSWDVSKVTNMSRMFYEAAVFNQNIGSWNVGNVNDMASMFYKADKFNQNIGSWNVSNVNNMSEMFAGVESFNQDISNWDVSNVNDMSWMFIQTIAFNQDLRTWDVSRVYDMNNMFYQAAAFNQSLGNWKLNQSVNLSGIFDNSALSCQNYSTTLKEWAQNINTPSGRTLGVKGLKYAGNAEQYRNILTGKSWTIKDDEKDVSCTISDIDHTNAFIFVWDTEKLSTGSLFIPSEGNNYQYYWEKIGEEHINSGSYQQNSGNLALTDVKAKTGPYRIYIKGDYQRIYFGSTAGANALALTKVESWGNISWTSMKDAFSGCKNLIYLPTTKPDLSKVENMSCMFLGASSFNRNISNWDVSNVKDMSLVFSSASSFNQDISNWDVGNVKDMRSVFDKATSFNQDISNWNMVNAEDLSYMFFGATSFNQNISNWNLTSAKDMTVMFNGATAFNQSLSSWNVSNVTNMNGMFFGATSFNQNISNWNVGNVTNMNSMFNGATSFNQNLGAWQLKENVNLTNMLSSSGLSSQNYGLTLKGWAQNINTPTGRVLGATGLKYEANAEQYHAKLITEKGWTITDGGVLPVDLISFTVKIKGNGVQINWQTASENNNSHFLLERSIDGINFYTLTTITAKGKENSISNYDFSDTQPQSGNNYYRLTQIDKNGTSKVYDVKTVKFGLEIIDLVKTYPNPVLEDLNISFKKSVYTKARITDINGKSIKLIDVKPTEDFLKIDLTDLTKGIYLLYLSGKENTTKKIIKN